MNKFYFTLLVFFFISANCFANTYTLSGESNWDGTNWSNPAAWSSDGSSATPPNYGLGTIIVKSGAKMIVSRDFNWNGTIYV
ncbi:MAG: hypothetical protein KY428_11395, partial [Bacteroidetes bacterium]|nr:hypothetical protein [Bacteroidota bacterium]